jgi:hypothetical protein
MENKEEEKEIKIRDCIEASLAAWLKYYMFHNIVGLKYQQNSYLKRP